MRRLLIPLLVLAVLGPTLPVVQAQAEPRPVARLGGGGIVHGDTIAALAFSSKGMLAVADPALPVVDLWAPGPTWAEPRLIRQIALNGPKPALDLSLSPDGTLIAAATKVGVEVHATDGGGRVTLFPGPRGERVRAVAFAPDGRSVYFADSDGVASRGVLEGGAVTKLGSLGARANTIAVSPDGARVAFGGRGPAALIHDVATGVTTSLPQDRLAGEGAEVARLVFLDRGRLAVSTTRGRLVIFDLAKRVPIHEGFGVFLARSPDGKRLAISDLDDEISFWSPGRAETLNTETKVGPLAWHPAGALIAYGDRDGRVRFWEVAKNAELAGPVGHTRPVNAVCVGGDDRWGATLGRDNRLIIWDLATARPTRVIEVKAASRAQHACVGGQVAHLGEGRTESGRFQMALSLVEAASGEVARRIPLPEGSTVERFALSKARAAFAGQREVLVLELETSKVVWSLSYTEGYPDPMVAFSPDGKTLAVGLQGGQLDLHDGTTGKLLRTLAKNGPEYTSPTDLVWAPSGDSLVAAVREGPLQRRDAGTGDARWSIGGEAGSPQRDGVAWSRDGKLVAFGGSDNLVHVVSAESGRELAVFAGHRARVVSVAFTSDRKLLVSGSHDGSALVWDISKIE